VGKSIKPEIAMKKFQKTRYRNISERTSSMVNPLFWKISETFAGVIIMGFALYFSANNDFVSAIAVGVGGPVLIFVLAFVYILLTADEQIYNELDEKFEAKCVEADTLSEQLVGCRAELAELKLKKEKVATEENIELQRQLDEIETLDLTPQQRVNAVRIKLRKLAERIPKPISAFTALMQVSTTTLQAPDNWESEIVGYLRSTLQTNSVRSFQACLKKEENQEASAWLQGMADTLRVEDLRGEKPAE